MNTFYIPEDNMARLEKQLATIQKKCNINQFSFHYSKIGEEFQTVKTEDDEEITIKYIIVEVEGLVKHEGWEFVAVLDHSNAAGNIIRAYNTELRIPDRYKTCGPICEHCNKIRSRKDTYIIYNRETDEFKQVGRSCLAEYTNGLDAETVAQLVACYEKIENSGYIGSSSGYIKYQNVNEILRYAFECYKHFGYEKAYYDEYSTTYTRSTRDRVSDYMNFDSNRLTGEHKKVVEEEMQEVNFDANSDYAKQTTFDALEWVAQQPDDNEYIRNLRIICSEEYTESRNFGMLVSLPAAYGRYLDNKAYEERKAAQQKEDLKSEYQGEIGDKLEVEVSTFRCVSTYESQYGVTWIYRWTDANNNIYMWYASRPVDNEEIVLKIRGTVKNHSEYKGVKQTIMTRCKVTEMKDQDFEIADPNVNSFEDINKIIDEAFYS